MSKISIEEVKERLMSAEYIEFIQKTTKAFNDRYFPATSQVSEKGQKVLDIINKSDFGCQKQNVADIMSIVLGEDLKITTKESIKTEPGILIRNRTGEVKDSDFGDGEVIMIINGSVTATSTYVSDTGIATSLKYWERVDPSEAEAFLANAVERYNEDSLRRLLRNLIKRITIDLI